MVNGKSKSLNRRKFIGKASTTVGGLIAFPTIISSKALAGIGNRGGVPASDKIVFGTIGIGSRGSGDLRTLFQNEDIVVVAHCNVLRTNREAVKKTIDAQFNSDIPTYIDFREMLERSDIDAILGTTGDRNHALLAVYSMRAGKDIYTEKPVSMCIQEGQALVAAQKRYGRVSQGGAQRINESNFIFARELVRLGRLGEVKTFQAEEATFAQSPAPNKLRTDWLPSDAPVPPKEEFWWDAWLGANPWMPYNSTFSSGSSMQLNQFLFYYNSLIGEWGSHTQLSALEAMDMSHSGPVEVIKPDDESGAGMLYRFADGREMVLQQNMQYGSCAVRYIGTEGWVEAGDRGLGVSKPSLMTDYDKIVGDYRLRTGRRGDHMRDFLDCIRSRRLTAANAELIHRSMSTVHLGNIALWLERDLKWNPEKEEFINDEAANRMRSRAQREPWAFV